jgi:pSer/pThr/pTyr-binding forkhead associated (FHA) protein
VAKLTVITKGGQHTVHEAAGTVLVGRGADCQIRLSGDPKISRQHCRIQERGGDFMLSDLNSANGTMWNGQNIGRQMVALNSGDLIEVGSCKIRFQTGGAIDGANRLIDRVSAFFDRLFKRSTPGGGEPVFGEKTITCSCGAVLSTASKSPGQKVGCPRCKKIYVIPSK